MPRGLVERAQPVPIRNTRVPDQSSDDRHPPTFREWGVSHVERREERLGLKFSLHVLAVTLACRHHSPSFANNDLPR